MARIYHGRSHQKIGDEKVRKGGSRAGVGGGEREGGRGLPPGTIVAF